MLQIPGITQADQSLQSVWGKINEKAEQLANQVANGDVADGSFVQTAMELQTMKMQASAAGTMFKTLNDLAQELLGQPRK